MSNTQQHIIIMGAPGCGKGTQAEQLATELDYRHLSTGDIFREQYANKNEYTRKGNISIDKGNFFSTDTAYIIINDFLKKHHNAKGIVFDGFPRNLEQAQYFLDNICSSPIVIQLLVDEKQLINRLLERGIKENRKDDSSYEIILNRMTLYKNLTLPVVCFFKHKRLLKSLNSEGSIEEVSTQIKDLIKPLTKQQFIEEVETKWQKQIL